MADHETLPVVDVAADTDGRARVTAEGHVEPDQPTDALLGTQLVVATYNAGHRVFFEEGSPTPGP